MKNIDYLKLVITKSLLVNELSWILSAFAITTDTISDDSWKNNAIQYSLVKTPSGYHFIDIQNDEYILVKIDDYISEKPLFTFQDVITIDSSWFINVKDKISTKVGNVIINAICIVPSFKDKIEFIADKVSVEKIESIIARKLKDNKDIKENDGFISVDELLAFADRLYFITNFSLITNIGATRKNISVAPDFQIKKKELLKKYEGQLTDPVKLVEFEKELTIEDDKYLADDPTVGKILAGKTKNMARKKMFLDFGYERGFDETSEITPILNSLEEGWSTDENDITSYMNALRSGSYSRGKETELGGVTYKKLQRSLSGLAISNTDCGTTIGLKKHINKNNISSIVMREVRINNKWVHIDSLEAANLFLDKKIEVRSAMYCLNNKDGYCYHCLSSLLSNSPNGVSILASELSSVVLGMFMALMHGVALSTVELNVDDLVQ